MSWAHLTTTLSIAAVAAVLTAASTALILRASGRSAQAGPAAVLMALISLFLILTHAPLPDPASIICPMRNVEPRLVPFYTIPEAVAAHPYIPIWVQPLVQAALANFLLCLLIGLAAARLTRHAGLVIGVAAVGSLSIELSQLTGLFGVYPCAIRQFDVDDLILNIGGVGLGFALMHRRRQSGTGGANGQS